WSEVLSIESSELSVTQSFFRLGGHSLKAISLVNKLNKELGLVLNLRDIFTYQDIRSLSHYIENNQESKGSYVSIPKAEVKAYYKLSSAQKRMYFLYEFDKESTSYNMPEFYEVNSNINIDKLTTAFNKLVSRHASLRTRFILTDDVVNQQIMEASGFSVTHLDGNLPVSDLIAAFVRPFNLKEEYPFRVGIVNLSEGGYILLIDMHHIVSDGVSHGILMNDFIRLYQGEDLPELSLQYTDYAEWQQSESHNQKKVSDKTYWEERYTELPLPLNLPYDYERPKIKNTDGASVSLELSSDQTKKLHSLSLAQGSTTYMMMLSLYKILLSKLSNQHDIVVGTPTSGRSHADVERMVGMFVNTLALRSYPEGEKSYIKYLSEIKEVVLQSFEHEGYQYEDLIDNLSIDRDTSRNPLFDVMFSYITSEETNLGMEQMICPYGKGKERTSSKFDMTLVVAERPEHTSITLTYNTSLFTESSVTRFLVYFERLIDIVLVNPDVLIGNISLLSKEEERFQISTLKGEHIDYDREMTFLDMFQEQVSNTPNGIALVSEGESISYSELDKLSNVLAGHLLENTNLSKGDSVGVSLPRTNWLIISSLAILKAGCIYIPIDPSLPEQRKKYIAEDSGYHLLIDKKYIGEYLKISHSKKKGFKFFKGTLKGEDLAYVIYTSGSTGKPKGVKVSHGNLMHLCIWYTGFYGVNTASKSTLFSGIGFDASIFEMFPQLASGSSIYPLNSDAIRLDVDRLYEYLKSNKITHSFLPTVMCHEFVEKEKELRGIKILTGGEALNLQKEASFELYNNYGPTEATVAATSYVLQKGDKGIVPIGKGLYNTEIYLLDAFKNMVPQGVTGELYIGGNGVSQGYLNNEVQTKEFFVDNPYRMGEKMYRTGDLACMTKEGVIAFKGRSDAQIQLRGHRIELGEIITQVESHPEIHQSVVIVKGSGNDQYLVCYYTSASSLVASELEEYLQGVLP
ncbi:non-ribosomal peptide synthetase, partial [Tenacibaculum sp. M341]|uniref:non-ribosomal peptide synthetase n=2 Tax=Tenacibaculum TaxID=104267 RepID=UPI0010512DCC